MEAKDFMIINGENGNNSDILGKFLYYSFPKLIINRSKFIDLVGRMDLPSGMREKHSPIDAFRCAATDVKDRIIEEVGGEMNIVRIYFRDNKCTDGNIMSRELVEETVHETTNNYRKLANIQLDKVSGDIFVTDENLFTTRDVYKYCGRVKRLYNLYLDSVGNRQIETIAENYVSSLNAIKISARGYHFFVPKQQMYKIELLEDKRYEYETILKQKLDDMDSEFDYLRSLCDEYRLRVNSKIRYKAA